MRRRDVRGFTQQIILGLLVFFCPATVGYAATYYVRTDGNNANNGLANTAVDAWRTIDWAADHVAAGDVVRVQAGTYIETASPGVDGEDGNTVTIVADGLVTTCGMTFSSRSYIRVIGFRMDGNAGGCSSAAVRVRISGTNTGLEFWNNDLDNSNHSFFVNANDRCNSCIILGGSVHNVNNGSNGVTLTGNDSFVGYVDFDTICYLGVNPSGNRLRFVNLNFSNFIQCNGTHPDFFYIQGLNPLGYSNSLIESMFGIGTTTSTDNKVFHAQNQQATAWNDNVWRSNVVHNMGSGFFSMYTDAGAGASNRWRFYNNSVSSCDRANNGIYHNNCGNVNISGSVSFYNNLFYKAWADVATSGITPWSETAGSFEKDYNLSYSPVGLLGFAATWTNQAHELSNVNPSLVDVANLNFTLGSFSGARGSGGPLTTASGSGSSSTNLTVAANAGSYFVGSNASRLPQYGGALVPGDFITVGSTTVQVASRSGDTLILAAPISWNSGAPVYFGSSSLVDIGAYPYNAGGYALSATYSCSAGTCTIGPSDTSLVRFVVCYDDGVPYAVDNAAPYTCAAPAGMFSARAYPRYASKALWTTATATSSAPGNLRIVP